MLVETLTLIMLIGAHSTFRFTIQRIIHTYHTPEIIVIY